MPVWRCPHCGIPQPESSRCWVCHRSTTLCGTCRHFRRGIASGLGLCGLDPGRPALRANEVRPCWSAAEAGSPDGEPLGGRPDPILDGDGAPAGRASSAGRTFVPVDQLERTDPDDRAPVRAAAKPAGISRSPAPPAAGADRWTLWSDPEA